MKDEMVKGDCKTMGKPKPQNMLNMATTVDKVTSKSNPVISSYATKSKITSKTSRILSYIVFILFVFCYGVLVHVHVRYLYKSFIIKVLEPIHVIPLIFGGTP